MTGGWFLIVLPTLDQYIFWGDTNYRLFRCTRVLTHRPIAISHDHYTKKVACDFALRKWMKNVGTLLENRTTI